MNKIYLAIIAILGIIATFFITKSVDLSKKLEYSKQNVIALSNGIEEIKINDSIKGIKITGLSLKVTELENINATLLNDAKELDIKNKNLESVLRLYQNFEQNNVDTIFISRIDSNEIKIQMFKWNDYWTKIEGKITNGVILPGDLKLEQKDTLKTATEIKYKRFWYSFWKRTPIAVQFKAYNTNPHKKIENAEFVKLR